MALAVGVPVLLALAIVPLARRTLRADVVPIAKLGGTAAAVAPPPPTLTGLDLAKIRIEATTVTAPLPDKNTARLSVDPQLQKLAEGLMALHRIPEAAIVLMDVQTGKILVYASHMEKGPQRDLCVEATAPAASVFKIVTGSALVEHAGASPEQRECYSGGEQKLVAQDLLPDPKRDRWCTTLSGAMGRSINTVFARLALKNLKPEKLEETAKGLGFGGALPFDVPVQQSALHFPEDQLGFARTAAGFWNTTLSPVHAAWLSATIARGGEPVRPSLVAEVTDDDGKVVWVAPSGLAQKRAIDEKTAKAVATMMDATVTDGTSFRAFHDGRGKSFLPGIAVAGKTGTLTDPTAQRFYTWFTGFAPSKPYTGPGAAEYNGPAPKQVAVAVLVVNKPEWHVKANVLAREVLRGYFATQKLSGVTMPKLEVGTPDRRDREPETPPVRPRKFAKRDR